MTPAAARIEADLASTSALATVCRQLRGRSVALAAPRSAQACVVQSMPDASPVECHLARTTWFLGTFVLERRARGSTAFHPGCRALFNSDDNAAGDKHPRPEGGMRTQHSPDEVMAHRRQVDAAMARLHGDPGAATQDARALTELGIDHDARHQAPIPADVKRLRSDNPWPGGGRQLPRTERGRPLRVPRNPPLASDSRSTCPGMDAEQLRPLSRVSARAGCCRGIQRQVRVQSVSASRRILHHALTSTAPMVATPRTFA